MKIKFLLLSLESFLIRMEIIVGASWKALTSQKNELNVICAVLTGVHQGLPLVAPLIELLSVKPFHSRPLLKTRHNVVTGLEGVLRPLHRPLVVSRLREKGGGDMFIQAAKHRSLLLLNVLLAEMLELQLHVQCEIFVERCSMCVVCIKREKLGRLMFFLLKKLQLK